MLTLLFSMACSSPDMPLPFNIGNGNLFVAGKNTEDTAQPTPEDSAEDTDDSGEDTDDSGQSDK